MATTNIQLFTPYDKQKAVLKSCLDNSSFIITVVAGRQSGKSYLSLNMAIYWALSSDDQVVMWVSPTATQAGKVMKQLINELQKYDLIKSHKSSKGDAEIIFNNNSVIYFKSAAQKDSLRGYTVNYMILDEAAFISQDVFNEVLLPMTNVAGKKILIVTTPKGKNWIHSFYLKGLDSTNSQYKSFKFNSSDNPFANKEIIEIAKLNLPPELFNQEYLAEFVDSASVFRNVDELAVLDFQDVIQGEIYYAGIDIGMLSDDTVITIINQSGDLVYYDAFTKLEAPQIKDRLLGVLNRFRPVFTKIETNNQGLPIYQLLVKDWPNLDQFTTTNESKQEIINQLIAAFSGKEIRILKDEKLMLQLQAFVFKILASGKIKYEAASGFHDDCVMSLALAWDSYVKNKMGNRYMVMSHQSTPAKSVQISFGKPEEVITGQYAIMGKIRPDYEREY